MSAGKYVSRVCIIHISSGSCLYDRIWPGDEHLWMSNDEKYDETEEFAMGIKFAVSGTKKERIMRQELISLVTSFYQISRSIDDGSVFKTAFQKPAENRQSNFNVKFTPHFGTLSRPKKNINTKISSLVFGQAQTEMVIASKQLQYTTRQQRKDLKRKQQPQAKEEHKSDLNSTSAAKNTYGEFICAVFYGIHCKPETAKHLAQKLIDEFFQNFTAQLQKLLLRLERERAEKDEDSSDEDDEEEEDDTNDKDLLELHLDFDGNKDDDMDTKNQEYIMAQFKSFDEIAVRMQTLHIDRRDRKESDRNLFTVRNKRKKQHKHGSNGKRAVVKNKNKQSNSEMLEVKSDEYDINDY